jgi:hypothetical protein
MQLLFFQIRPLLIIELHKVVDEVQVMTEIKHDGNVMNNNTNAPQNSNTILLNKILQLKCGSQNLIKRNC